MSRRLVIVGAGISGLAAARGAVDARTRTGVDVDIIVIDRADVVGGKARTIRRDGWMLEAGPTGYLDNEPLMDELVDAAGLTKLVANEAAARRFLVQKGRLKEIQTRPQRFLTSGVLSPLGVLRLATEPFRRQVVYAPGELDRGAVDESVWEFAARRLGRQAADRLIAPMVLGVFAGDAKRISLPAAFPRMAELERDYGSLFKALRALKKEKGDAAGGPAGPSGKLTSFAGGLAQLPTQLAQRGEASGSFSVRTRTTVNALRHDGERWYLHVSDADGAKGALNADALVLAGECYATAALLAPIAPDVAQELSSIPTPPVAVVGIGYGKAALDKAPTGFGALVQRGQGIRILGMLWDTHLFPQRSPDGTLLIRCMVGGATDEDSGQLTDNELLTIARADVDRVLGLSGAAAQPVFTEVVRWPRAIPQYELGHIARVTRIRAGLEALSARRPGLHLAGNYLAGVAFAKAARCGYEAGVAAVTPTPRLTQS